VWELTANVARQFFISSCANRRTYPSPSHLLPIWKIPSFHTTYNSLPNSSPLPPPIYIPIEPTLIQIAPFRFIVQLTPPSPTLVYIMANVAVGNPYALATEFGCLHAVEHVAC
jgi:hypothetical protein